MAERAFLNPSPPDLPPPLLLRPQGLRAPPAGRPVAQDRPSHGPAHGWGSARTEHVASVAPPLRSPHHGIPAAGVKGRTAAWTQRAQQIDSDAQG